jgi:hypothetical protein
MSVRSWLRVAGTLITATAAAIALIAPPAGAATTARATTAPTPKTFTWSGADSAAGVNDKWSDPGNWQGGVAPTPGQPVNLVFPPLHCTATGPCGDGSANDLTGMQVARLTIQTGVVQAPVPPNYELYGNPISLSAGLVMTEQPSTVLPEDPVNFLPIQLTGSQTWTMDRSGMFDYAPVTGPTATLTLKVAHGSDWLFQETGIQTGTGGADLGGLKLIGANPADTGQRAGANGQMVVVAGAPFTVSGAVTIADASAFLSGTVGPLSMPGSQLWLGASVPPHEGILASTGNITFGSQSFLTIDALFPGKAGQFYPQIRASGKVALGGLVTIFQAGCAQPRGTRYTLIAAKGGVSGLLSRIVHGKIEPIPQGAIIETQENDNYGTCEGPPPQWIQIHYNDSAGTVTATAVPKP